MLLRLILLVLLCTMNPLQAQTPAQPVSLLPNIAVTPFVGDETVTNQQLIFLTGKFAGELMATKAFQVLDRGKMDYILMEQGFQQSGACNSSECQVQMGQLLGVDFIVSGNLVRFGSKYAFRADYIDVGSGQVVQSVERSESGDLEDVYEALCKGAAITLAQSVTAQVSPSINGGPLAMQNTVPSDAIPTTTSHPLSFKRKLALAIWGTSLVGAGGGVYFNNKAKTESDHYYAAVDAKTYYPTKNAYDEANTATKYRMVSYGASLGTFVIGAVLWFLPEGK